MNGGDVLSRRYMIFGATFICLGYLNLVKENKRLLKIGVYCFIPIGLCLNISSYYTSLSDFYQQQQALLLDGYYWKNHKMLLSFGEKCGDKIGYNHPTYMISLINKIDSSGIYKLSQTESLPLVNLIKNSESNAEVIFEGKIDTLVSIHNTIGQGNKVRILFEGIKKLNKQNIQYFALKSQKNIFIIPAVPKTNSFENCVLTQSLNGLEFYYEIWKAKFLSDLYEIWVIKKNS